MAPNLVEIQKRRQVSIVTMVSNLWQTQAGRTVYS